MQTATGSDSTRPDSSGRSASCGRMGSVSSPATHACRGNGEQQAVEISQRGTSRHTHRDQAHPCAGLSPPWLTVTPNKTRPPGCLSTRRLSRRCHESNSTQAAFMHSQALSSDEKVPRRLYHWKSTRHDAVAVKDKKPPPNTHPPSRYSFGLSSPRPRNHAKSLSRSPSSLSSSCSPSSSSPSLVVPTP